MIWILILSIYLTADKGGVSIVSVEFSSKENCQAAGKAMSAEWRRGSMNMVSDQSRWVCVQK
jgi:hypothetical protein